MFDRIATRYDFMNRVITFGIDRSWRRDAVRSLHLTPGQLVLDLACGTGDLYVEAAAAGARVIGADRAAEMLRVARRRDTQALLVRADAACLPLADSSCDGLLCGFALRNFVDLPRVFRECARVTKPGARLALLEVDTPSNPVLRWAHGVYFHRVVPWIGALLADRQAYDYLPSSAAYMPDSARLGTMLEECGFENIHLRPLLGGVAQLITAGRRR